MERSSAASTAGSSTATSKCPSCGTMASGKFCSNCGATLAAADCAACGATLRPGAKFCHRCGTPAGAAAATDQRSFSSALPWGVAAIALVALIALLAGQHFGGGGPPAPAAQSGAPVAGPFAGATGSGPAPDISNLTADQAASRLYDRIMMAYEAGHADTVQMFAPMAISAYQMIDTLDLDERYDMGRIALISGQEPLAQAEADTILSKNPTHLLGLILATEVAEARKDNAAAKRYHAKLVASAASERAKRLPEYFTHENDITAALDSKNAP